MGVYLSFDFIKKTNDIITGSLPSLKMYEANLELTEKNYYNNGNDSVSFKHGGYIFRELDTNAREMEYYTYYIDSYFINLTNLLTSIEERPYEEMSIYLFEIEHIKSSLENILNYARNWKVKDQAEYEEDLESLLLLYKNVEKNLNENVFVSCHLG